MALRRVWLSLLALLLAPAAAQAEPATSGDFVLDHPAADPGATAVSAENLLASERFWPWQVALVRPWQPEGLGQALSPDHAGVLIRVETSTRARIDFGRDGVHEVPIEQTDLVARADRVRRGELAKAAPNFVWAIGARLLDSAAPVLAPVSLVRVAGDRVFLCVFADPRADDFPALTRELAPLRERRGVATILFPQGERPDAEVHERLRSLGWTVPFVHDHLSESYTRSLLTDGAPSPVVMLQTDEGRVLLQRGVGPKLVPELERAIDGSFPAAAVASGAGPERSTGPSPH